MYMMLHFGQVVGVDKVDYFYIKMGYVQRAVIYS